MGKQSLNIRDIPPGDRDRIAQWLSPRPGETYEQWSRRFDRGEREIASRLAARKARGRSLPGNRPGSSPARRAA